MDALEILLHDGQHKEINHIEFVFEEHSIQEGEEEEEEEEVKEEEEEEKSEEESEGYQTSEEEDE